MFFFFQAEDGIRDLIVTGVQTCALPISGVMDVVEKLKPRLVGEDPMEVDRLWTHMMRLMSGPGSIAGTTVAAISGIEIALLDLVGKHLKTPVYQLLGGKFRNRIRIYADSHAETLRFIY